MKTTTAFRILNANRMARRNVGGYNVRSLKKDGTPSKVLSRDHTGREEFSQAAAEEFAAHLAALNPTSRFVVTAA